MRFIIYGAGAIGCVVGGRLHQHGKDVLLIARGEHGICLREHGLRLESAGERADLRIPTAEHVADVAFQKGDVVLLAMKSQHTAQALEALSRVAGPDLTMVTLQNGVENERLALRLYPNVIAACVMCPATHLEPGAVQANSSPITGLLDVGRYPGGVYDTVRELSEAFTGSSFQSIARTDVMRWKYAKLLLNLGNAAEALCGPEARGSDLVRSARREGEACLNAAGIDFASEQEDRDRRADHLKLAPIDGQSRSGSSSWQSLQRSTGNIESDYLNGEIVLLGRTFGVATPVNALLQRLANKAARFQSRPGSSTLEAIQAELG
jgi:2-dehydropantoate 2-reductase